MELHRNLAPEPLAFPEAAPVDDRRFAGAGAVDQAVDAAHVRQPQARQDLE